MDLTGGTGGEKSIFEEATENEDVLINSWYINLGFVQGKLRFLHLQYNVGVLGWSSYANRNKALERWDKMRDDINKMLDAKPNVKKRLGGESFYHVGLFWWAWTAAEQELQNTLLYGLAVTAPC